MSTKPAMKGRYRQVVTAIWNDRKVRELPPDGKLLFIYLITCGHGHVSGLYLLPIAAAARETGLSERRIRALLVAGEMTPVVSFDPKFGVVWVRSMLKHQGRGEKIEAAVTEQVRTLADSNLSKELVARYGDDMPGLLDALRDTASDAPSDTGSGGVSGAPFCQEKEQEKEKENVAPRASAPELPGESQGRPTPSPAPQRPRRRADGVQTQLRLNGDAALPHEHDNEIKNRTNEGPPAPSPSGRAGSPRKPRRAADGAGAPTRELIDHWKAERTTWTSVAPETDFGHHARVFAEVWNRTSKDIARAKRVISIFFAIDHWRKTKDGASIRTFQAIVERLLEDEAAERASSAATAPQSDAEPEPRDPPASREEAAQYAARFQARAEPEEET